MKVCELTTPVGVRVGGQRAATKGVGMVGGEHCDTPPKVGVVKILGLGIGWTIGNQKVV